MTTRSEATTAACPLDPLVSRACPRCGHIHSSDDARAINRFSAEPTAFIAKHCNTPRRTREEAENDECAWRVENRTNQPPPTQKNEPRPIQTEMKLQVASEKTPKPAPKFPAAAIEAAAREKAWLDFLAHVNMSLMVWQIDDSIHSSIDAPTAWMRRCCNELWAMLPDSYG